MTPEEMIERDKASWEARLRQEGGSLYDPSDLDGMIRQVSYSANAGRDPMDFINAQIDTYAKRNASTDHRAYDSQSGYYENSDPRTEAGYGQPQMRASYVGAGPARPLSTLLMYGGQPGVSTTQPVRDRTLAALLGNRRGIQPADLGFFSRGGR